MITASHTSLCYNGEASLSPYGRCRGQADVERWSCYCTAEHIRSRQASHQKVLTQSLRRRGASSLRPDNITSGCAGCRAKQTASRECEPQQCPMISDGRKCCVSSHGGVDERAAKSRRRELFPRCGFHPESRAYLRGTSGWAQPDVAVWATTQRARQRSAGALLRVSPN